MFGGDADAGIRDFEDDLILAGGGGGAGDGDGDLAATGGELDAVFNQVFEDEVEQAGIGVELVGGLGVVLEKDKFDALLPGRRASVLRKAPTVRRF